MFFNFIRQLLQSFLSLNCQNCFTTFDNNSYSNLTDNGDNGNLEQPKSPAVNQNANINIQPQWTNIPSNFTFTFNMNKKIIHQYISYCHYYTSPVVRVNPGIFTALRFSLPNVLVSPDFHDTDMMLALVKKYLKYFKIFETKLMYTKEYT